jgi:hypothetical protein
MSKAHFERFTNYSVNARIRTLKSMKRLFLFLSLIFCLSYSAFAQQRPLLTEDVDTTPEGSFELAAGVDFLQNAKFPLSGLRGDQTRVGDIRV